MKSELLVRDENISKDLATVNSALTRWGSRVLENADGLFDRLLKIASKEYVEVITPMGDAVPSEDAADKNAMKASEIMLKMIALSQKGSGSKSSPTINVGVNVDASHSGGSLAREVAERIRAERLLEGDTGRPS